MTNKCDKCGAPTRWYDERCPACGAVRAVELPTTPIPLPCFTPSAVAPLPPSPELPEETEAPQNCEQPEETKAAQNCEIPEETKAAQNSEVAKETKAAQNSEVPEETKAAQNSEVPKETEAAPNSELPEETETAQNSELPEETEAAQNGEVAEEPKTALRLSEEPTPSRSQQRLAQIKSDLAAWRSAFNPRTASVTLPPTRTLRYALGIALELLVCPPCALVAAYFFTRALRADRRARYYAAMNETEKARLALGVGLGVFALTLCAFMYYVHSHEIRDSAAPTFNRLFR